jgi:hypothetical protein
LNATLFAALGGTITSAGARVYFQTVPPNIVPAYPYIIFDYVNESDVNDTSHRLKNCVVSIKAYANTQVGALNAGTLDGQIDTALHRKTLNISGWTNIQTQRENAMALVDTDAAGKQIYAVVTDYRILADK